MIKYITPAIILICCISCNNKPINKINDEWNTNNLDDAWKHKDTAIVKKWINSLSDTLNDFVFYTRVVDLSSITNFYYGNSDPTEKEHWQIPERERILHKRNVVKGYQLYESSCLFMKETTWDATLPFQDHYYPEKGKEMTAYQIKCFKMAIDSLCIKTK